MALFTGEIKKHPSETLCVSLMDAKGQLQLRLLFTVFKIFYSYALFSIVDTRTQLQFFSIANTQFMKQFTIFSQLLTQSQNFHTSLCKFQTSGQSQTF